MKVCVVGATGLLGYQGSCELVKRGHKVVGLALPPKPEQLAIPKGLKLQFGNFMEMSESELRDILDDCEGLVFAAGVDERVESAPPIYQLFKKYNVDALRRLLDIARAAGVKKVVVLGSHFTYFAKLWPDLELAKWHPYIRSRVQQEALALEFASGEKAMDVAILELPYIFGAQTGRKPVWMFIAEMIKNTKGKKLYYPKGGTTMVTVRQVGEAIAGALERTEGGRAYPVGWFNLTWQTWLEQFARDLGMPKKVVSVPTWLYKIAARGIMRDRRKKGLESGLEMVRFANVMTAKTYIDKKTLRDELGVRDDDIEAAIRQSAEVCRAILDHPEHEVVEMRAK